MKIKLFVENQIQTNCWVLIEEDSNDAVIIDLGGGYKKILEYLKEENTNLKYILCTHGHFDHIMGIAEMQKDNIFIPVYMSQKDYHMTSKINSMLQMFGMTGNYPQIKIDKFIDETTELKIGEKTVKIIETPGHSQGGLCFYTEDKLFCGDSIFCKEIGRCDLEGGDYDTLINSLKTKVMTLPDDTTLYPGHGPSTSIAYEKKYNYYVKEK